MSNLYFIEITDVYGGEANYSWVTRHAIKAKSVLGAVQRMSRMSGLNWRGVGCDRWDSRSGATCMFVKDYDPEYHAEMRLATDETKD